MILSELIPFLKTINAKPKKHLSQNFLIDSNIVRKIIETAEISPNDSVLEIGPGPGSLTKALLDRGAFVYAVEMDFIFAKELHRFQNGRLQVFEADFLTFPLDVLPKNLKIVANLPYHITTPILEKIFSTSFSSLTIMVQKEVGLRMMASAGTKQFGSLTLFVQFYSHLKSSFHVSSKCFYPQPKVDSTVIRLDAKKPPDIDPAQFFHFVHKAFQKRRKMLINSLDLPKDLTQKILTDLKIRPDIRPEDLSFEQWVHLVEKASQFLFESKKDRSANLKFSN